MVAVAHGPRRKRCCIRTRAGLSQTITGQKLHRAQFRQPLPALRFRSVGIDHPRGHVVDRHISRDCGATGGERLEDQSRIETRERRPTDICGDIDPAHAKCRGFAHLGNRKVFGFIPGQRVRRKDLGGERLRHVANCDLVLSQRELRRSARGFIEHEDVSRPGGLFSQDRSGFCVKMPRLRSRNSIVVFVQQCENSC